jgi:hypothetical protein
MKLHAQFGRFSCLSGGLISSYQQADGPENGERGRKTFIDERAGIW